VNTDALARAAVEARPHLLSVAYRMLGSMSDAEDVVQDALVKVRRAEPTDVDSPVAYLTAVTTRTAIDHLRSARVRREAYVGPWLPEPVLEDPEPDAASHALLADSLSMAFLVVLEALGPEERAVLLLHDVFGYSHAEVATVLGRTEAGCRQLLRRARQRIEEDRPRFEVDPRRRDDLVRRFQAACQGGDLDPFLALLTDDAVLVTDGGGEVKAARLPIRGSVRIAGFLVNVLARWRAPHEYRIVSLNGTPALAMLGGGRLIAAAVVEPGQGDGAERVAAIRMVRSPAKLVHVRAQIEAAGLNGEDQGQNPD